MENSPTNMKLYTLQTGEPLVAQPPSDFTKSSPTSLSILQFLVFDHICVLWLFFFFNESYIRVHLF